MNLKVTDGDPNDSPYLKTSTQTYNFHWKHLIIWIIETLLRYIRTCLWYVTVVVIELSWYIEVRREWTEGLRRKRGGGKEGDGKACGGRRQRACRCPSESRNATVRGARSCFVTWEWHYLDFFPFYLTVDSDAHAENLNFCILTCPNFSWRIGV